MPQRTITPSKITAWLDCEHFLALKHQVEDGLLTVKTGAFGAFAQLLADKGLAHEQACMEAYAAEGKSVYIVPQRHEREPFAAWMGRIEDPLARSEDVLYQVPLAHDGIRGIADFLVRGANGAWEPVDAKLARKAAKPGHVLQLCFYADALEDRTGWRPQRMHLWLGSNEIETLEVREFDAYWRRLRSQLADVVDASLDPTATVPVPCDHCQFCEFADHCDARWREEDSLLYVAGLRSSERPALHGAGVLTLAALAANAGPVQGLTPERQSRMVVQADLQRQAREALDAAPPYVLIAPGEDATWGRGSEMMPPPDDGDVFLDFEGHPFWRADRGLFFLFGLIELEAGEWRYRQWWAHDEADEGVKAGQLIDYLATRRLAHPEMHVYHYNHTERSSLEALALEHGVGELVLNELVETGVFVDLFVIVRNAVQVGAESYGLKSLEVLAGYVRGHDIDKGAGAVLEYEAYMAAKRDESLRRIAAYNEDDVRATRALRDWLVGKRPDETPWRDAVLQADAPFEDIELVQQLHGFGVGTPQHLMGDLLGYWHREWRAFIRPKRVRCEADHDVLLPDPEALTGLVPMGEQQRLGKNDKVLDGSAMRFAFPEQDVTAFSKGDAVVFVTQEGPSGYASIDAMDVDGGTVDLKWKPEYVEAGVLPTVAVRFEDVSSKPKPAALTDLAEQLLVGGMNPVSLAVLQRALPQFAGDLPGLFTDDLEEMLGWAGTLDGSYVAIQGPPGTGKTFRGAHLVRTLILAGKRVGITAMSHNAIDNLLEEVLRVFSDDDLEHLRAVRRVPKAPASKLPGVAYTTDNKAAANLKHNLVCGTTWLFAGEQLQAAPVDVLVVDEAGQLALADALTASRSGRNLILLGDPLQLPQVAQASHPGGSGSSVLEHILGDNVTIPPDRGVFLAETRRMHPDVCDFISDVIYEGRLSSHPSCAVQNTEYGTGLRWLQAEHTGRVTECQEEAELVSAEVLRLLGTPWTDHEGLIAPLGVDDLLVVAPYNDQVSLIRQHLHADARTQGVAVGTVDKFQGRQAAVVFFTMTTSSSDDMVRGADFLFSRNRFNVAISRARCLAYLVCTKELLDSRGRDVEDMRLISTMCAFVERVS